jgi:hypothetical protein
VRAAAGRVGRRAAAGSGVDRPPDLGSGGRGAEDASSRGMRTMPGDRELLAGREPEVVMCSARELIAGRESDLVAGCEPELATCLSGGRLRLLAPPGCYGPSVRAVIGFGAAAR